MQRSPEYAPFAVKEGFDGTPDDRRKVGFLREANGAACLTPHTATALIDAGAEVFAEVGVGGELWADNEYTARGVNVLRGDLLVASCDVVVCMSATDDAAALRERQVFLTNVAGLAPDAADRLRARGVTLCAVDAIDPAAFPRLSPEAALRRARIHAAVALLVREFGVPHLRHAAVLVHGTGDEAATCVDALAHAGFRPVTDARAPDAVVALAPLPNGPVRGVPVVVLDDAIDTTHVPHVLRPSQWPDLPRDASHELAAAIAATLLALFEARFSPDSPLFSSARPEASAEQQAPPCPPTRWQRVAKAVETAVDTVQWEVLLAGVAVIGLILASVVGGAENEPFLSLLVLSILSATAGGLVAQHVVPLNDMRIDLAFDAFLTVLAFPALTALADFSFDTSAALVFGILRLVGVGVMLFLLVFVSGVIFKIHFHRF